MVPEKQSTKLNSNKCGKHRGKCSETGISSIILYFREDRQERYSGGYLYEYNTEETLHGSCGYVFLHCWCYQFKSS
jgi:hypothetical protein